VDRLNELVRNVDAMAKRSEIVFHQAKLAEFKQALTIAAVSQVRAQGDATVFG
jgi:hypothetical protein